MQLLADYLPLILFFVAFKLKGIYVATAVAIAASVIQIAWFAWRGKVSTVHWLSLAIIVVFGGATLLLQDETFIKWKPTVLYGLFGSVLAVGKLAFRRDWIAVLLKDIALPAHVWSAVTWSWVAFFAAMAVANWYVAFHFTTETWVNFKVWGGIGLFLALRARAGDVARAPHRRGAAEALMNESIAETIRARLAPLEPSLVDLHDDSAEHVGHAGAAGGGGHFSLVIVSKVFRQRPRLARHRAVLDRVADLIPHPLHALAIQAYTPEEFPSNPEGTTQ